MSVAGLLQGTVREVGANHAFDPGQGYQKGKGAARPAAVIEDPFGQR